MFNYYITPISFTVPANGTFSATVISGSNPIVSLGWQVQGSATTLVCTEQFMDPANSNHGAMGFANTGSVPVEIKLACVYWTDSASAAGDKSAVTVQEVK